MLRARRRLRLCSRRREVENEVKKLSNELKLMNPLVQGQSFMNRRSGRSGSMTPLLNY